MFFWSRFPFVRVALFFIPGILAGVYLPGYDPMIGVGLAVVFALFLVLLKYSRQWLLKLNWLYGLAISLSFFLLGYLFLATARETTRENHLLNQDSIAYYQARIVSDPVVKGDFLRAEVKVQGVKDTVWQKASGRVLVYFRLPLDTLPAYGSTVLIKGQPQPVRGPRNPFEFDYRQYLTFNNIYHQQFVGAGQWLLLPEAPSFSLKGTALAIRTRLEEILSKYIEGKAELAIAKALILGNKKELDKPTRELYARAGAMHVLAVSGLHVGIIYMVLLFILGQGKDRVKHPVRVAFVVIPALWLYAFITGLSPSVLRAVTMFSFLALAQALGRKSNTMNTLALSAFILLLVNPLMIMAVGFQLSYIAVVGIILWYPVFERLLNPANNMTRLAWQLTALSMAAQLATAPLSALYFHRFPTYFFASNLLVIPAATVIVWGGLALLTLGSIAAVAGKFIGMLMEWLISMVNTSLYWLSGLPKANIDNLAPSIVETWLVYGIIIFLLLFILQKKILYLRLTTFFFALFSISLINTHIQASKMKQIVFYSMNRGWAIDLVAQRSYTMLADSALVNDHDKLDFLITPNRRYFGLSVNSEPLNRKTIAGLGEVVVWHGKVLLLANNCLQDEEIPPYFDFVLFTKGQSTGKCNQEQILLRKFVNNQGAYYEPYDLRSHGALVVDI